MSSTQVDNKDVQLKHLGFVRVLTLNAVVLVCNIYDYAKQNAGSVKSKVENAENSVRAVVGPVYERFKGVPDDILVFLDHKVDEATHKFNEYAPASAKRLVFKAKLALNQASKIAQDLADEAKVSGPLGAVSRAGTISKHIALTQLAFVWYKLNQYPALHGVSQMAFPTIAHWSEKYNKLVTDMTVKGYGVFNYVPLVPVEEITKAYKQAESGDVKKMDSGSSSDTGSDKE